MANMPDDRDAIRVAAASIIAQQAALAELEMRLRLRETTLAEQEAQVASRLEKKRTQLAELHRQLGEARDNLRHERDAAEKVRLETDRVNEEAKAQRQRLREIHPRFINRLKRAWLEDRRKTEQQQSDLKRDQTTFAKEVAAFRVERAQFEQLRNQVRQEKEAAAAERAEFAQERDRVSQEQVQNELRLKQQIQEFAAMAQRFAKERPELERQCANMRDEARGLELRIASARRTLAESEARQAELAQQLQTKADCLIPPIPVPEPAPSTASPPADHNAKHVAAVADQRAHLVEMLERLKRAEADWQTRQLQAVAEMEEMASRIQEREEQARDRIREAEKASERIRAERDRITRMRADFVVRQSVWQTDRAALRAELDEREQRLIARESGIESLFARWRQRRTVEVEHVRQLSKEGEILRQACSEEREQYRQKADALRIAQQSLTEQLMAFEEARAELLHDVDPSEAAKRIERLRRRWADRSEAAEKQLAAQGARLAESETRLLSLARELDLRQAQLLDDQRHLAGQASELERQKLLATQSENSLLISRQNWNRQKREYDLQLVDLRAEIELFRKQSAGGDQESQRAAA